MRDGIAGVCSGENLGQLMPATLRLQLDKLERRPAANRAEHMD